MSYPGIGRQGADRREGIYFVEHIQRDSPQNIYSLRRYCLLCACFHLGSKYDALLGSGGSIVCSISGVERSGVCSGD